MNRSLRTARLAAASLALVLVSACGGSADSADPPAEGGGAGAEAARPGDGASASPGGGAAGTSAVGERSGETDGADPAGDGTPADEAAAQAQAEPNRFAPGGPIPDEELANYHVSMQCAVDGEDIGTMTFDLWTDRAPITTRNFLRLVDSGFYDGLSFHRILRDFMVQGGDPSGTGMGNSPYGTIVGEFSDAPNRSHGYGVLSMARMGTDPDSASSQFFLCCDESASVWGLDGKYASFGRLTSGVATLEALADVPVRAGRGREISTPTKNAVITDAEVHEGEPPSGETVARPEPPVDLGGEPERIVLQHVLISFAGRNVDGVTRTREEAEALAREVLAKAEAGEDMDVLVREYSDDPVAESDPTPGHYTLLNNGVRDRADEKESYLLQVDLQSRAESLQSRVRSGELTQDQFQEEIAALQAEAQLKMGSRAMRRAQLVPAFGDVGFSLEVGDVELATFDEAKSPFGYHVIKRVE